MVSKAIDERIGGDPLKAFKPPPYYDGVYYHDGAWRRYRPLLSPGTLINETQVLNKIAKQDAEFAAQLQAAYREDLARFAELARHEELGPDQCPSEWGATTSTTVFPRSCGGGVGDRRDEDAWPWALAEHDDLQDGERTRRASKSSDLGIKKLGLGY